MIDPSDMSAVLNGGDDFRKRINDLQEATAAFEQARTDLGLAKKAKEVHAEAARIMASAKEMMSIAEAQASKIVSDARISAEATTNAALIDAKSVTDRAEKDATAKLSAAQSKSAELMRVAEAAHSEALVMRSQSEALLSEAQETHRTATDRLASADKKHTDLSGREAKLLSDAKNLRAAIAAIIG